MSTREIRLAPEDWPQAVADTDGRQIVVAGPGTGKTEFLVRRVAHLVASGEVRPEEIVVLSFNRRAARSLQNRVVAALGPNRAPVDITTFHSLASRIIEMHQDGEPPTILTTPEQVAMVGSLLATETPTDWPLIYRPLLDSPAFAAEVADFLMRCSERMLDPDRLQERAKDRADWRALPGLYARYLQRLGETRRTDYGVLLTRAISILAEGNHPTALPEFRYVLVDEYQDTSPAQAEMAEILGRRESNLTVAGDPYQSVYSFRGAELGNIAGFTAAHLDTKRLVLARSFRVPAEILSSALTVVSGGDLPGAAGHVEPASHRGRCDVFVFDQETAESEWIAREVERAIRVDGLAPSSIAILVRSKKRLLTEISRALARRDVPHDQPDARLVDHPAIRLLQDLVTVTLLGAEDPAVAPGRSIEADDAMRRILLGPLVGVALGQERELRRERHHNSLSWPELVRSRLPGNEGLVTLLEDPSWAHDRSAAEGFWTAWSTLDRIPDLVADPARDEWRRVWTSFAQTLGRQAERDPGMSLARYFELASEEDFEATPLLSHRSEQPTVTLTTLHQSKGLEFDVVFIADAVEGVFPDLRRSRRMLRPELLSPARTTDPEAQHLFQLQEEMRLAYTAMTRARLRIVWTATEAAVDQGEHRPSRFLLAAASASGIDRPGAPPDPEGDPVTVTEAEIHLRRVLLDPSAPAADRLAAARVLGRPAGQWWDPVFFAGYPTPGPDSPILDGPVRLSPSQAQSYQNCPRRYALERRLGLGDPASPYALFGMLIHQVLERAEAEVIGTGAVHADPERVMEILEEVWEEADFGTPSLDRAWKAKARETLSELYERWPSKGEPIAVEMRVEDEIEGIPWVGYIDRVERDDEALRVIDYKTSTKAMTNAEAEESIQLAFYARALMNEGMKVSAAEAWYPRAKTKSVARRLLDLDRLPDVTTEMGRVTRSIRDERWEPQVGEHCERCQFLLSCPAWPEGRGSFLP